MSRYAAFDPQPPVGGPRHGADCVRVATADDVDAIARLSAAREGHDEDAIREPIRRDLAGMRPGDACVFVAEVEGRVVAYGRVRDLRQERDGLPPALPEGWYLNGVVVDPHFRRRGLGRALTEARIAWVRERAAAVHYVSNPANRASIAMHARLGFEPIASGFDYPRAALTSEASAAFRLALT